MARRATGIKGAEKRWDNILVLDAGNALTGQDLADASAGQVIIEAMNRLGYDAMTIGERELYLEYDQFMARVAQADFPILSANVIDKQTGEPITQAYAIAEVGGFKVGILGLTNANATKVTVANRALGSASLSMLERVSITDPIEAARAYLPQVAIDADIVIALSHLGVQTNLQLAQEVPGFAAIISGGTRQLLTKPLAAEDTVIVEAGYDGEWMGTLELVVSGTGEVTSTNVVILTLTSDCADDVAMARWLADVKKGKG